MYNTYIQSKNFFFFFFFFFFPWSFPSPPPTPLRSPFPFLEYPIVIQIIHNPPLTYDTPIHKKRSYVVSYKGNDEEKERKRKKKGFVVNLSPDFPPKKPFEEHAKYYVQYIHTYNKISIHPLLPFTSLFFPFPIPSHPIPSLT